MRQLIDTAVGLSDSRISGYTKANGDLLVRVRAWNGQTLVFHFSEAHALWDGGAGEVTSLCEETHETALLARLLDYFYEERPTHHPYRVFQFLDLDDRPALEVVAEALEIRSPEHTETG